MPDRYYCQHPIAGADVTLEGPEARHLASVMRAEVGDTVVLFDGTGFEFQASVTRIGKRDVQLTIESKAEVDREAAVQLTLAVAMPKSERQKWLIEKAVELGVARIVPIVAQRSVVKLKASGIERLRRTVIEASKQCGRNRLMEIADPVAWKELIADGAGDEEKLIAHPGDTEEGGSTDLQVRTPATTPSNNSPNILAAIGPEGGFTDDEVQSAIAAGWQSVSLGPRILRVETAALSLAARLLDNLGPIVSL